MKQNRLCGKTMKLDRPGLNLFIEETTQKIKQVS